MLDADTIHRALGLLGGRLQLQMSSPIALVVCGGSSLIVWGVVSRVTRDVDVVAIGQPRKDGKLDIIPASPLPDGVIAAASQVARDLGLDEHWLNPGPSDLMKVGLPTGYLDRAKKCEYGILTVYFLGRYDQIHLKVYAAVDSGPGRHVEDLLALKPTEQEMELAARWAITQDPSEDFCNILKDMLRKLKYESVAEKV